MACSYIATADCSSICKTVSPKHKIAIDVLTSINVHVTWPLSTRNPLLLLYSSAGTPRLTRSGNPLVYKSAENIGVVLPSRTAHVVISPYHLLHGYLQLIFSNSVIFGWSSALYLVLWCSNCLGLMLLIRSITCDITDSSCYVIEWWCHNRN